MLILSFLGLAARSIGLLLLAALAGLVTFRASAPTKRIIWLVSLLAALAMPVIWRFGPEARVAPNRIPGYMSLAQKPAVTQAIWTLSDATKEPFVPDQTGLSRIDPTPPARNPFQTALIVWAVVSGLLLLRIGAGLASAALLVRKARPFTNSAIDRAVLAARLRRPVRIMVSPSLKVPATAGMIRPVVILPQGAQDWSERKLQAVLAHELAHVRQGDWIASLAAQCACALYPFNPFVWLCARRFRIESELSADNRAVMSGIEATAYASSLVEIASGARRQTATVVAMANSRNVEARVRAIVNRSAKRRGSASLASILLTGISVGSACMGLAAFRMGRPEADDQAGGAFAIAPTGQPGWKGPIAVKVLDENGRPCPNAKILVMLTSPMGYGAARTGDDVVTDANGLLTINAEMLKPTKGEPETFFNEASIDGIVAYRPGSAPRGSLEIKKENPSATVQLTKSCAVRVHVLDPYGRHAAGVELSVRNIRMGFDGELTIPKEWRTGSFRAVTDATGTAVFRDIPEGWGLSYEIGNDNYLPAMRLQHNPACNAPVTDYPTLHLVAAATVEGDVIANGKPLPNVNIQLNSDGESWVRTAKTDAKGHYRLTRVPARPCDIHYIRSDYQHPEIPDGLVARQHDGMTIRAGQSLTGLNFVFTPGAVVRGRIVDENGKPQQLSVAAMTSEFVEFQHGIASNPPDYTSTGNEDGRYEIRLPPGRYKLRLGIGPNPPEQWVEVRPGQVTVADFAVDIKSRTRTIGASCGEE